MKVICDRAGLVEALKLTSAVVVSRTPKPVLTCVKLTASDSALTLAATDLEVAIRLTTAKVEIAEPGEVLLPADKLTQIVDTAVEPTVSIETEEDAAHIRGADSHFKIYGFSPGDFPPVPEFEDEPDFETGAGQLSQLIHQTIYATARENSRYAINGVLIEREGKQLNVVATDGHRLALAKGTCKVARSDNRAAIIPTKALQLLLRLLHDPDGTVKVKIAENRALISTGDAVLTSNLVEGNFPPFRDVIPKDGDKKATVSTDVMASAVRRAALLTNEESKGVSLSLDSDGLTLTSRAPEMGEAQIKVDLAAYEGEPISVGFNPHYILDALKVAPSDQIILDMKAPNKPGILRSGSDFLYVIMPVSLE